MTPINIPTTDIVLNANPYSIAANAAKIAVEQITGFDLSFGLSDAIGGAISKAFGGDTKRSIPVAPIKVDGITAPLIKDQGLEVDARNFSRYHYVNEPLNADKERVQRATDITISRLNTLGFRELSNNLLQERNKADRVPASPAAFGAQIDALLEITNANELFIDSLLTGIRGDETTKNSFEQSTGISFPDFEKELEREYNVSLTKTELNKFLSSTSPEQIFVRTRDKVEAEVMQNDQYFSQDFGFNQPYLRDQLSRTYQANLAPYTARVESLNSIINAPRIADISKVNSFFQNPQPLTVSSTQTVDDITPLPDGGTVIVDQFYINTVVDNPLSPPPKVDTVQNVIFQTPPPLTQPAPVQPATTQQIPAQTLNTSLQPTGTGASSTGQTKFQTAKDILKTTREIFGIGSAAYNLALLLFGDEDGSFIFNEGLDTDIFSQDYDPYRYLSQDVSSIADLEKFLLNNPQLAPKDGILTNIDFLSVKFLLPLFLLLIGFYLLKKRGK